MEQCLRILLICLLDLGRQASDWWKSTMSRSRVHSSFWGWARAHFSKQRLVVEPTISSPSSFLSFMERTDRLCWRSWKNVRDANLFVFHAIERKISMSNNATLRQSELIWMFFISYDKCKRCFPLWEQKTLVFDCTLQCCSFKNDMAMDLDLDRGSTVHTSIKL